MLKASAPQNNTRKGSWCFVAVLDSRTPSHLLFDGNSNGLIGRYSMGDIGVWLIGEVRLNRFAAR